MATVVNVVNHFFQCNYATISTISVKIIRKYAASAVNNAEKGLIILTTTDNVIKLFWQNYTPLATYFPMILTEVTLLAK